MLLKPSDKSVDKSEKVMDSLWIYAFSYFISKNYDVDSFSTG